MPNIVIVGGGFGGLTAAKALKAVNANVTLIDKSNHHLFQPLLYQVATATLSPADIATPIRSILRDQTNAEVLMAEVIGIEPEEQRVVLKDRKVPYDYLIVATGARHGYFGNDTWEANAPGLKSITDATQIRQRVLLAFEQAEMENDETIRRELLSFILVGGGPTGVEMAGAIAELAQRALALDFRRINPKSARVLLVEAGPRILTSFPETLSTRAERDLLRLGVEVKKNSRVDNIDENGIYIGGKLLRSRNVIWTAGVFASKAGQWLSSSCDRAGRVQVQPDLSLPGRPNVFVIGDTATLSDSKGKPLPGVAPVALQQGKYVAQVIRRRLRGKKPPGPFVYVDKGNLATIGRSKAIADFNGRFQMTGYFAWLAWLAVHVYFLIGFRNRLLVVFQWAWSYFTFARGARLITDQPSKQV